MFRRFPEHGEASGCDYLGNFLSIYPQQERLFAEIPWFQDEPENAFVCEGQFRRGHNKWMHVTCPGLCRNPNTGLPTASVQDPLIIAADGACQRNGDRYAQSAVGVWFGDGDGPLGNQYNVSQKTIDESRSTSSRAELSAAIMALHQYDNIVNDGARRRDGAVIIKMDSAYVVRGVTEYVKGWRHVNNRWIRGNGHPLLNSDLWESLLSSIFVTEAKGTRVLFWWVAREQNALADALAISAFRRQQDPWRNGYIWYVMEGYMNQRKAWMQNYAIKCGYRY